MRIMDSVLLLFNAPLAIHMYDHERCSPVPSWKEALCMLNGALVGNLMTFNKDIINSETCEFLAVYLEMDDYTLECAKRVCGNVAGLLSWIQAMSFFYSINIEVLPIKSELALSEGKLVYICV